MRHGKKLLANMAINCHDAGMENGNILDFVLGELQSRRGTWRRISVDTHLDYSWLTKLGQGRIPDPSVNKIQRLADHFGWNQKDE